MTPPIPPDADTPMPVRRKDPTIRRIYFRDLLLLGLPFAALCWFATTFYRADRISAFLTAIAAATAFALFGLLRQDRLFRRYRCPECGMRLEGQARGPGASIEFHCPRCDVVWETGFSESSE